MSPFEQLPPDADPPAAGAAPADPWAGHVTRFPGGAELHHKGAYGLLVTPDGFHPVTGRRYEALRMLIAAAGQPVESDRLTMLYSSHDTMRATMLALRKRGIPVRGIRYVGYVLEGATHETQPTHLTNTSKEL